MGQSGILKKKHKRGEHGDRSINPHLSQVIGSFRRTLKGIFVFSFFINLLMLAVPMYLIQIYDKVIPNHSIDTLYFLTGITLIALVALGFLEAVRRQVLGKLGAWFENQLGEHLLSSAIVRAVKKGRSSVNVLHDLTRLRRFLSGSALLPILDLPWAPVYIIVLYLLHPLIGLLVLVGTLVLVALAIANQRITRNIVAEADTDSRGVIDSATTYVRNADVIQAMGMQSAVLQRWSAQHTDSLAQSYVTGAVTARLASWAKFVKLLLQIGVICLAAWLVLKAQLSAGSLIACVLLFRRAVSPLEQSIRSWEGVINARSSFNRINEYLEHAPTLEEARIMPEPQGTLAVERISFRRSGDRHALLNRVSMQAKAGDVVAIVGDTAAGKSSFARLLVGILTPDAGRITLGGFELKHWSAEDLGRHVGYLPQDVELFPGTIRENIARLQEGDINKVMEAAKLARAHDLIQRLPEGYNTEVGENGSHLSGGQRQRIALARVLYGEPKLVVLDEPDANLDSEGRAALIVALRNLRDRGAIVILITHQPHAHLFVDRVCELRGGRLTKIEGDDGNYESVVRKLRKR